MIKTVNASPLTATLKGAVAALLISTALIVLSALPLTNSAQLDILSSVLPKAVQALSALVGGIFAGRSAKDSTILCGLLCGAIYGAVIIIGSLIFGEFKLVYSVICLMIAALASLLGAFIGVPKEKSEKSRRKALMKKLGK